MRTDKHRAIELRKMGKSYADIAQELRIPKSTLSAWFASSEWSQKIKKSLDALAREKHTVRLEDLNKIRGNNLKKLYAQAHQEAFEDFEALKYHPTFISGVMLYWGEGDKTTPHRVSLTNTDPKMIRIFLTFLQNVCGVDQKRIKAWLLLYPDIPEESAKKYWLKEAGLKNTTFNKSIVIKGKHPSKRLGYGVCTILLSSRYFKEKMLVWISLFSGMLADKELYVENADII